MTRNRTMVSQFKYAVMKSKAFGESKHDERGKGSQSLAKCKSYSFRTYGGRLDVAKQFGKFLQENHPEIRMARDVTFDAAQEWLDSKAYSGCTKATLEGYTTDVRSLFRLCERAYPTFSHVTDKILRENIKCPEEHPELVRDSHRDAVGMIREDYEKLRDSFSKSSNGYRGCLIGEMTGARSEGCVRLKGTDIHIENGKCWVHLTEKGGLQRDVDVVKPEYIKALQGLKSKAKDGYVLNHRGNPIKAKSLSDQYRQHMKKLDLSRDYTGTNSHAIRKLWANERYHEYRKDHSKYDTVRYMNQQLGHGADRDEELLGHYVDDIN